LKFSKKILVLEFYLKFYKICQEGIFMVMRYDNLAKLSYLGIFKNQKICLKFKVVFY